MARPQTTATPGCPKLLLTDWKLGVLNAAIYGGGVLANPTGVWFRYGYTEAPKLVLDAVAAMNDACLRHGTDLATAALRFSMCDPACTQRLSVSQNLAGSSTLMASAAVEPPPDLWIELEKLGTTRVHAGSTSERKAKPVPLAPWDCSTPWAAKGRVTGPVQLERGLELIRGDARAGRHPGQTTAESL